MFCAGTGWHTWRAWGTWSVRSSGKLMGLTTRWRPCKFQDLYEFSTLCLQGLEYVITKREIKKFHVVVLHLNDGKDVCKTITGEKIHGFFRQFAIKKKDKIMRIKRS